MAKKNLIFVDANIWLDFYRSRTDAGLKLLHHLEKISARVVATYQLEMEFKKNRQAAILEGLKELKAPQNIPRPGMFYDAKQAKALNKGVRAAEVHVKTLKARLTKVLEDPAKFDPVYQACQRLFHKHDGLVLLREDPLRRSIRRQAFRRFLHGCPPRKSADTSIGDPINWEWMIHCAIAKSSGLVIVSRDSDYGILNDGQNYINDHLRQEFSERVSNKRDLLLFSKLSEALKHFSIPVTAEEVREEEQLLKTTKLHPRFENFDVPDIDWGEMTKDIAGIEERIREGIRKRIRSAVEAAAKQSASKDGK